MEVQLAAIQQQFNSLTTGQQCATQHPPQLFQQRNVSPPLPLPTMPPPQIYQQQNVNFVLAQPLPTLYFNQNKEQISQLPYQASSGHMRAQHPKQGCINQGYAGTDQLYNHGGQTQEYL